MGIVHFIQDTGASSFRMRWACLPPSEQCLCTANDIETDGLLFVSSRRHRQPNCPLIAPERFYLVEEKEDLVGAVGIELLKQISKSHVFAVIRRSPKTNWSQMELSCAVNASQPCPIETFGTHLCLLETRR